MTLPRQRHVRHADDPQALDALYGPDGSDAAPDPEAPPPAPVRPDAGLDLLVERLAGPDEEVRSRALRELVALADVRPGVRGVVVRAVCAYLRSPWAVERGERPGAAWREPERRRDALALLTERLRDPRGAVSWCGYDLDLSGAVLAGADFSGCWFTGGRVRLEGAWAVEGRIAFDGARFGGSLVSLRHWTSGQGALSLRGARFSAGVVSLAGAVLDEGTVDATDAVVDGGTLAFTDARLVGGVVDLSRVTVSDGLLTFADAWLRAGHLLLVDARFTGGLTTLRDVRAADGVLVTEGALLTGGHVDVGNSRAIPQAPDAEPVAPARPRGRRARRDAEALG